MSDDEKRHSDRVVPMVSDEEMVVVDIADQRFLAKLMDLSDSGTLVYLLLEPPDVFVQDAACRLSFYHQGAVFSAAATIARTTGRLLAFRFDGLSEVISAELQAKLIRMEVEWARLRALI